MPEPASHLHTIPVDPSLTVEEAWRELCLMGVRATDTGEPTWATIRCDGVECDGIARDATPDQVTEYFRTLREMKP